ncbi:TraR/DksA family transcriptional regulator [Pelagicoccus albus]|uniref:TraR/DksA C4-type zinc finger protein n=1 Tax=Pelagicoccus albus TaxID=415222 RepID=A0A7X1B5T9_9BACT|nr:TraR/DksA C4-type zinc finger protein [Pelagicoccus albus]MBC2606196.1 TraR/DksA C4-type zinc finger protein [Pelagicoccus albus]
MPDKKTPAKKAAKKVASKTPAKAAKKNGKKSAAASGFSLDDALAIASTRGEDEAKERADIAAKEKARKAIEEAEAKKQKQSFGAASLADILGYNPAAPAAKTKKRDASDVPAKYKKFYDLLVQLRDHVKHGLSAHTEETLKRSSKDDAGDLSGYSQHMADAGTDTFDRDFALSMVSSEQDALQEIEAAIDRIFDGTYGFCEMTGKQIRDERLMAVPFTRYSMKTQEQIEKNTFRTRAQSGGVFADASSEDSLNYGSDDDDN